MSVNLATIVCQYLQAKESSSKHSGPGELDQHSLFSHMVLLWIKMALFMSVIQVTIIYKYSEDLMLGEFNFTMTLIMFYIVWPIILTYKTCGRKYVCSLVASFLSRVSIFQTWGMCVCECYCQIQLVQMHTWQVVVHSSEEKRMQAR